MITTTLPIYIIYKHTCIISGKSYIGQTMQGENFRWKSHIQHSKNNSNFHFHRAIRKYGKDNFIHEILFSTDNPDIINEKEIEYIAKYDTYHNGYNMTIGGEAPMRGRKLSKIHKEKISLTHTGKHHTKETKEKLRQANLGKRHSKITKEKMSLSTSGKNHPLFGKHHTKETKEKISIAQSGKKQSKKHIDKNSGKKNYQYKGDYHTPWGRFNTAKEASTYLISYSTIINWCNNPDKIISKGSIRQTQYLKSLKESPLGKTFREIGFYFEPINQSSGSAI